MDVVLNWLWQGVMVATALFVLLRLLEDAPARIRYTVCGVALSIVLTIPVLRLLSSPEGAHPSKQYQSQLASARDLPAATTQPPASRAIPVPATPWTSAAAMLGLWFVWAGAQGFRVSSALIGLRQARHACRPFPTEIEQRLRHWMRVRGEHRQARLVVSDGVGRAAVLGCGTPIIAVAPALIDRLSADELDHVVIHEWAHVQRRDDLVTLLQLAVRVVAGWHPAVWWIDRRLQVEREVACDEMAVAVGGSAKSYASCLVKLSDASAMTSVSLAAPGVLTGGRLRYRVIRIVSGRRLSSPIWAWGLGTAVVAGLLAVAAVVARVDVFTSAETPAASSTTMVPSSALERLPARHLAVNPITGPNGIETVTTQATRAAARWRRATSPSRVPAQEAEVPPADSPGRWLGAARVLGGSDQPAHVETPEAVTADASPLAPDPPSAPAAVPPAVEAPDGSRTPWGAAGDAGVAVGRRSKAAGVATAGAFTRFARRVAGSF